MSSEPVDSRYGLFYEMEQEIKQLKGEINTIRGNIWRACLLLDEGKRKGSIKAPLHKEVWDMLQKGDTP